MMTKPEEIDARTTQPTGNTMETVAANAAELTPAAAWSRRVRRIGGFIQTAFAALWLSRASLAIGGRAGDVLVAASAIAVTGVLAYAIKATAGTAPRPRGPQASRIGRSVTVATVIELAAAFMLPVVVIAAGHPSWALPSIVVTIGPLLLWLDHLVQIPRYRLVGWALTAGPVILAATMSGPALAVTTGIAAGALLLGTAAAGFRDLAALRPVRPPRPSPREGPMIMPQEDSPTTSFRPFFNPATGEWITYTAIAEDSNGQLVRFNWRSMPNSVIPEHIHPRQQERFTILAGEAHFTLNGQKHVARAGETVVIPAGVPHSVANPGPAQIDSIVERRPARQAKEFHEAVAGLAADGKTTPAGAPKNPLQLGATFWHFRHESRITSPPIWVQNLMLPPLWALAKVFGVRPYYHHWDSRSGTAGRGHPDPSATAHSSTQDRHSAP
jgi:mannose-6-phosphate isomerase-like protein (cupin superfamily)